ncbi:RluA family pseudouridine synthase [Aneurinibacillus uraniidurans]|uniref:RluA family pseudouridine synthase n=1 Tax=Aneurinibacillus uraniidurans TaxID=2966586 RepID=UPI00234A2954|nr:RluA family pseudouridine synthase [Aneurinibacillus sp. B1]WCN38015.1 RluA family pseudouridine synthase [Aneurinibacillus sp. B1]
MTAWKMDKRWLEYEVEREIAGWTLERVLKEKLGISGRMIQRLTRQKGVHLNRKQPYLQKKVKKGDEVKVRIADAFEPTLPPVAMDIHVLYEDDALLVVNKPAGLAVHPVNEKQTRTLAHGISHYWTEKGQPRAVRPVHRLDKETSGAILIAKNGFIQQLLDKQLREHAIRRTYLALVSGHPAQVGESGTFSDPIARDPHHPTRRCVSTKGDDAITHYTVRELYEPKPDVLPEGAALVEIELETGRTHQIRVHFSHHGFPILGDTLYGGPVVDGFRRQALHAVSLTFSHPLSGEVIECMAPAPDDFVKLRDQL